MTNHSDTNQEILTKAIEKAIAGGWNKFGKKTADWRVLDNEADNTFPGYEIKFTDKKYHWFCTSNDIIFNHDFAKTLWGHELYVWKEEPEDYNNDQSPSHDVYRLGWQYHLQQMVVADDPIKYLGENI